MSKRKRSSVADAAIANTAQAPDASILAAQAPRPPALRKASSRRSQAPPAQIDSNPDTNRVIEDGQEALRASPDSVAPHPRQQAKKVKAKKSGTPATSKVAVKSEPDDSPLSSPPDDDDMPSLVITPPAKSKSATRKGAASKDEAGHEGDPEADEEVDADEEEVQQALSRPPPVNSSYLPLPWKGRLGYACLNTYLRNASPPVFSSRTCRIASILEHRHPLKDPTQPEHATKNRPDKDRPADIARGQAYVEALGLANARDIAKMLRWNDRYGIKFLRLSSEMFPFASHDVYGYKLAPFASEVLAEAGRVAAELGHRLTTHPGQFTQLGSPRKEVITASFRDLEYHCELLDLLKLPPQQDRDAVMILHMGGIFGDKTATLERFKENYQSLSSGIKKRLVLENDDVCYSVHDLLPICEELNIPLVLDFHHHNLYFDADKIREGTYDIMNMYDRIRATWTRKDITQKMHYSEPTPAAITVRQRRKHNPRPFTLPPCVPDMDLMIEAKDKEQAVFELMRNFRLPAFDTFNDILPYVRNDENKPWKPPKKKTPKKKKGIEEDVEEEAEPQPPPVIPEAEVGMGGPEGRVYWPPGMEEWLRPKKREVKPKEPERAKSLAEKAAQRRAEKAAWQAAREASAGAQPSQENEASASLRASATAMEDTPKVELEKAKSVYEKTSRSKPVRASKSAKKQKSAKAVPTPSTSDHDDEEEVDLNSDLTDAEEASALAPAKKATKQRTSSARTSSGRTTSRKQRAINYAEHDEDD